MVVAALNVDEQAQAHVRTAVRGEGEVRACRYHTDLSSLVVHAMAGAVLTSPWDAAGAPVSSTVRALRQDFPAMPILVYCDLTATNARELVRLARAGADDVIVRGVDDVGAAFRPTIALARNTRVVAQVLSAIGPRIGVASEPFVTYCLEHPAGELTVARIARGLRVHRKTLVNRLSAARLPAPSIVVSWCRLLTAAGLMEDAARPVDQIALSLNFGSGAALRNMLRRYTGLRPSDVRERGGLSCVLDCFRAELERGTSSSFTTRGYVR